MDERRRVFVLILIMTAIATGVTVTTLLVLYGAAFEQQRARLVEIAHSQARLMEAVARFDRTYSDTDFPGGAFAATLSQIEAAHESFRGFGQSGEFTLAKREGDQIVFLLSHRHHDLDHPEPIPFASEFAEPMRQALLGESGTVVDLDYRGAMVLAAYEPVAVLDLGIVAKIDLAEIREPFVEAGLLALGVTLVLVAVGTVLFLRVSNPLIRRLYEAKEAAEAANRAKSTFLSNMSHELRTPLTAIIGYSEMLQDEAADRGDTELISDLENIGMAASQLLYLISDILDLSKIEAGHMPIALEPVDLAAVVDECFVVVEPQAREKTLGLRRDLPPGLPSVVADRHRLSQVLMNLLGNAVKFTSEGTVSVEVALVDGSGVLERVPTNSAKTWVVLAVKDTGIGIAPENQEIIFDEFQQVDDGFTRRYEGTGLGLALSRRLVEMMQGRLWVESVLGEGSAFYVLLPAAGDGV